MAKHIYIIDTCVLLHDPYSLYKFADNDIYLPLAVIDDLDDMKTKRDIIGWSAREVFRHLEAFTLQDKMVDCLFTIQSLLYKKTKDLTL